MLDNYNPIILSPLRELNLEDDMLGDDYTPFIQVLITISEINSKDLYIRKYRALSFSIQELQVHVEA